MARAARLLAALAPALLLTQLASAGSAKDTALAEEFRQLRERDTRVQNIGWRLLTGNIGQCPRTVSLPGLLVQDAGAYTRADEIRSLSGIKGDFFVQSVTDGGPAEVAGITPGMEIAAIDGWELETMPLSPKEPWLRLETVKRRIAASLAQDGRVAFRIAGRDDEVLVRGVEGCASEFEMLTGNAKAVADGRRVAIGANFVGFDYPEDEFAAALAHELAHNLLDHARWLDRVGRKRKPVRRTEREADRLMPWLLANAGYDPSAAARFMRRWGPEHSGGWFRRRTHDGWDERVEFIEAELPQVARSRAAHPQGIAAWRTDFRREIEAEAD